MGVSVLLVPPARKRRAELLLQLAGIDVSWGNAPTADEIRKLDQERMLSDALFTEETTSEDLILARALLAERSPEDIAAALARFYRARLPSPEDILDPGQSGARFRAAIGRKKNAEARWLLPMICRRGGVDKHDIGAIRILDTTTEFEISKAVAESFATKIRRPDKEDNIRIEPLAAAK